MASVRVYPLNILIIYGKDPNFDKLANISMCVRTSVRGHTDVIQGRFYDSNNEKQSPNKRQKECEGQTMKCNSI